MRRFLIVFFLILILSTAVSAEMLVPGGQLIGLQLDDGSVTVAGFAREDAKASGLQKGDRLLMVDDHPIACARDVKSALEKAGKTVALTVLRGEETKKFILVPSENGLGLYLRQGTAGLGTVTYYDPDTGAFGALGHGVNDPKGQLLACREGSVFSAEPISVKKGQRGKPGQILGSLHGDNTLGTVRKNVVQGVFGKADFRPDEPLPVAQPSQVQPGKATIRATVDERGMQEYSVEILKIYPDSRDRTRNLLLKITDEALLAATGGIVQGMSGSPIIQDGKLIGAVTHVLVNDPTTGYGIFIENMLDAAA